MTDSTFLYFAYGSNLGRKRLCASNRAPSAQFVSVGSLPAHRLTFDKVGKDGSAKCDCAKTGDPVDAVWGALYKIDAGHRHQLDRAEGLGYGYDAKIVMVKTANGPVEALTYVATMKAAGLKPFNWYKHHVC